MTDGTVQRAILGDVKEVRKAGRDDMDALATTLARAFDDDPVISWVFPGAERRPRMARRLFAMRLGHLIGDDEVYTADANRGGAVWALPDRWKISPGQQLTMVARLLGGLGLRTRRVLAGLHDIERRHPTEPHYYLAVLGVDPDEQGQGLGSALMGPVLRSCDEDRIPAYLESSKERNVDFYGRHGFRVLEELRLPAGPPVWLMWRDPR
jgi:ribosomal protein S18 acetylase RimI-like enzyme